MNIERLHLVPLSGTSLFRLRTSRILVPACQRVRTLAVLNERLVQPISRANRRPTITASSSFPDDWYVLHMFYPLIWNELVERLEVRQWFVVPFVFEQFVERVVGVWEADAWCGGPVAWSCHFAGDAEGGER